MSTVTETDPAKLPQWQGRPVPWATKWSGEEVPEPLLPDLDSSGAVALGYRDGVENRDEYGYLWRREGIGRGGEPQFKQLNGYRQKACMRTPRCHVCGVRLPKDRPIHWLLPPDGLTTTTWEGTTAVTLMSPPTCDGCVPLARRLCPHLRAHGSSLLEVRDFRLWGVIGEAFMLEFVADGPRGPEIKLLDRVKDAVLQYGVEYEEAGPKTFVVRQQIVELLDWEVIES